MRGFIFVVVSSAVLSMASLAVADDQGLTQPAGYNPSKQVVCIYSVHEGMVVRRADCRTAHAWANEKERNRQEFRLFLLQSLTH
jgi:hypothetical protein